LQIWRRVHRIYDLHDEKVLTELSTFCKWARAKRGIHGSRLVDRARSSDDRQNGGILGGSGDAYLPRSNAKDAAERDRLGASQSEN